jgi:acyl-coenzyme A synthetase/AMP-(fatty) acid ligase
MKTTDHCGSGSNLVDSMMRKALEQPNRLALIDPDKPANSLTYGALREKVIAFAAYFREQGLAPGRMVLLNTDPGDQIPDLVAFLALTAISAGVYVSSAKSVVEQEVVGRLGIEFEISSSERKGSTRRMVAIPDSVFPAETPSAAGSSAVHPDALHLPWLVRSTSGTTGVPKIFITTQGQAAFRRQRYFCATGLTEAAVFMSFTPIRFGAARQRAFYALSQGASVVIQPRDPSITALVQAARQCKATHLYCVPMYLALMCRNAQELRDLSQEFPLLPNALNLESSSSVITPELSAAIRSLVSPNFSNSYSISEVGHISSTRLCSNAAADQGLNNIGVAVDGVEIAIVNEQFENLPAGKQGRIAVRFTDRPTEVAYLNQEMRWISEVRDGFFIPGDLGYISPGGNLIYEGRADDMMVFNGINIFPTEIERAASSHRAIVEAAAFGVDSDISGQVPCVAVVLSHDVPLDELFSGFQRTLGPRAPRHMFKASSLPRNPMGKVLRRELARQAKDILSRR